ncbi:hypothetical protein [Staphylospora marina]|uniref:hypothetical protein n=1 Tax=Staphylospora marina TaxID=2490858 RepID=UPI000F5C0A9E|nr:hypothetical protein [Staphylospora marina]
MFKIYASGDFNQLNLFLRDLKAFPGYHVCLEARERFIHTEDNKGKIVASVEMEPSELMIVTLDTANGSKVRIPLSHGMEVKIGEGLTCISGLTYDIFG